MYQEYLGEGYHDVVRLILNADDFLVTDSMIDADMNIGAMKMMISEPINKLYMRGKRIDNEADYALIEKAARYYLAGILCVAIRSRIKNPPYNVPKYKRKNWDKKRKKCMEKGWVVVDRLEKSL